MGSRLQLVITADALGLGAASDTAIFDAWEKRAITQASLVVAGPTTAAACEQARKHRLPLVLQLDFLDGAPSAPAASVPSLAPGGRKRGLEAFQAALGRGEIEPAHLARETEAQLLAFTVLTGRPPNHVDARDDVHNLAPLAEVLAPIFSRSGVLSTRITTTDAARTLFGGQGIRSTDGFARCDAASAADIVRAHAEASSLELACAGDLAAWAALPLAALASDVELASFAEAAGRGALR